MLYLLSHFGLFVSIFVAFKSVSKFVVFFLKLCYGGLLGLDLSAFLHISASISHIANFS